MAELNHYELRALRMLAGDLPVEGGAWFNVCCETLKACGYATGIPYAITPKGRALLNDTGDRLNG